MSSESDLIDAEVAAYRDRDLERFVNYFSPSVKVMDASGRTLMEGAEALRTYYGQLFADSPNLAVTIVARIAVGQFVIDHERIEGVVSHSRPPSFDAVCINRIEDGRITTMQFVM